MPASGRNSKVVTTGPGLIWTTWPEDVELGAFLDQDLRGAAEIVFADRRGIVAAVEQRAERQAKTADVFRSDGDGAQLGIGALADRRRRRLAFLGGADEPDWRPRDVLCVWERGLHRRVERRLPGGSCAEGSAAVVRGMASQGAGRFRCAGYLGHDGLGKAALAVGSVVEAFVVRRAPATGIGAFSFFAAFSAALRALASSFSWILSSRAAAFSS